MAKILIADDDPDAIEMLASALKRYYQIIRCRDGEEALDKAMRLKPDLILLDLVMPKIDGAAVSLILKESQATRNIPVIFFTGHTHYPESMGLDESSVVLAKPVRIEELLKLVRKMMAGIPPRDSGAA